LRNRPPAPATDECLFAEHEEPGPTPVDVVVDLSSGGQKRGSLAVSVTVERMHRVS
jgi:hypothetical protein